MSQLRKCVADTTSVVPLEDITVDEGLNYVEKPIAILDNYGIVSNGIMGQMS